MLANTFLKPSSAMSRRRHPPEFDCPWASLIEQVESVSKKSSWFSDFSGKAARAAGHPMAFVLVGGIVIVWLITGPLPFKPIQGPHFSRSVVLPDLKIESLPASVAIWTIV
jgi:hypothetical protein